MIGYKIFRKGLIDNGIKYELGEHVKLYDDPTIYGVGFKLYQTITDGMWYWKQSVYKDREYEIALIETIGDVVEDGCCCKAPVFATNEFIVKEVFSKEFAYFLWQKEQCIKNLIELSYKKVNDVDSKNDLYNKIYKLEKINRTQLGEAREKDLLTIKNLSKELEEINNKKDLIDFVSEVAQYNYCDETELFCPSCGKRLVEDDFKIKTFVDRYKGIDLRYWKCGNCSLQFNVIDYGNNKHGNHPDRDANLINDAKQHKEIYENIISKTKEFILDINNEADLFYIKE